LYAAHHRALVPEIEDEDYLPALRR